MSSAIHCFGFLTTETFCTSKDREFCSKSYTRKGQEGKWKENSSTTWRFYHDQLEFCPSLPSCLAQWFSSGSTAHPSIALYPRLISSLSQVHRWEESPGIHHQSCSYHSRAPKRAVACSKWTTFLVLALPVRLLHYFLKMHQAHEHKQLTQLAHTFFLVVTWQ